MLKLGDVLGDMRFIDDGFGARMIKDPMIARHRRLAANQAHGSQPMMGTHLATTGSEAPLVHDDPIYGTPRYSVVDDQVAREGTFTQLTPDQVSFFRGRGFTPSVFFKRAINHSDRRFRVPGAFDSPTIEIIVLVNPDLADEIPSLINPYARMTFPIGLSDLETSKDVGDRNSAIWAEGAVTNVFLDVAENMIDVCGGEVTLPADVRDVWIGFFPATGTITWNADGSLARRNISVFSSDTKGIVECSAICFGEPIGDPLADLAQSVLDGDTENATSGEAVFEFFKAEIATRDAEIGDLDSQVRALRVDRDSVANQSSLLLSTWMSTLVDIPTVDTAPGPNDGAVGDVQVQKLANGDLQIRVKVTDTSWLTAGDAFLTTAGSAAIRRQVVEWAPKGGDNTELLASINANTTAIEDLRVLQASLDTKLTEQLNLAQAAPRTVRLYSGEDQWERGTKRSGVHDPNTRTDSAASSYDTVFYFQEGELQTHVALRIDLGSSSANPPRVSYRDSNGNSYSVTLEGWTPARKIYWVRVPDVKVTQVAFSVGWSPVSVNIDIHDVDAIPAGTEYVDVERLRLPDGTYRDEAGDVWGMPAYGRLLPVQDNHQTLLDQIIANRDRLDTNDRTNADQDTSIQAVGLGLDVVNRFLAGPSTPNGYNWWAKLREALDKAYALIDHTHLFDEVKVARWDYATPDGKKTGKVDTLISITKRDENGEPILDVNGEEEAEWVYRRPVPPAEPDPKATFIVEVPDNIPDFLYSVGQAPLFRLTLPAGKSVRSSISFGVYDETRFVYTGTVHPTQEADIYRTQWLTPDTAGSYRAVAFLDYTDGRFEEAWVEFEIRDA